MLRSPSPSPSACNLFVAVALAAGILCGRLSAPTAVACPPELVCPKLPHIVLSTPSERSDPAVVTPAPAVVKAPAPALAPPAPLKVESADMSEEQQARTDLASAYHLAEYFGWSDVVWGHMTFRLSSGHYLTHRYGLHFDEITPENLLKVNANGDVVGDTKADAPAFFQMHKQIHSGANTAVVLHLHPPHSTAVSALKHGLVPLSTDAMSLQAITAYASAAGESEGEGHRGYNMATPFERGDKRLLFLRNHGVVAIGDSVAAAFTLLYLAERSSKVQLLAQAAAAGGDPLVMPSDEFVKAHAQDFKRDETAGQAEWTALLRLIKRERHQQASVD